MGGLKTEVFFGSIFFDSFQKKPLLPVPIFFPSDVFLRRD
jgi:hypothetical protein